MYIGQIGCHISTRISEHIRDTRLENQKSSVAEYSAAVKHSISFDKTEIIASIYSYQTFLLIPKTSHLFSYHSYQNVG